MPQDEAWKVPPTAEEIAADAWHAFDLNHDPGGIFATIPPSTRAKHEEEQIANHGSRPDKPAHTHSGPWCKLISSSNAKPRH
jgi:hypothetical protein